MKYASAVAAALVALAAVPAAAQDTAPPGPITVSGNVALVTDYRLRGVSQSDEDFAIQGGITVSHESGFYVGAWMSSLAGWGTFGGCNCELDLIGGFKTDLGSSGAAIDLGVTTYVYPGGFDRTTVVEPFVKLSGTLGPATALVGVAYAPEQESLGNWSNTTESRIGDKEDNLYLWTDLAAGLPNTPVTLKAHLGYSNGNPGLGPNGTSLAPTGEYVDWMLGADLAVPNTPLTLGVAYVDTNIGKREAAYLQPNFSIAKSGSKNGDQIADSHILFSVTAAF